jgi:hypothetical protein
MRHRHGYLHLGITRFTSYVFSNPLYSSNYLMYYTKRANGELIIKAFVSGKSDLQSANQVNLEGIKMSVHEDTLQGLNEALEYARDNLRLKTTIVEVPDEEIKFYSIYSMLSETKKKKLMNYVNDLLHATKA